MEKQPATGMEEGTEEMMKEQAPSEEGQAAPMEEETTKKPGSSG